MSTLSQMFPPKPKFTEKDVLDQSGKVFIVTGSSTGIGKEVAQILYSKNTKVYVAARSEAKATAAIKQMKSTFPKSKGAFVFIHLDLEDLASVKAAAEQFLAKEDRLDVLFNNAGMIASRPDQKTKQGYEMNLGVNTIAPFLFTKLLTPILVRTARQAPPASVRVVWVSSSATYLSAPEGGVDMTNLDYKEEKPMFYKYGASKAGNYLHSSMYAKLHREDGVVSVSLNPGNLKTELTRDVSVMIKLAGIFLGHAPIYGAYTELFAAFSPEVTTEKSGSWIIPWGRFGPLRKDVELAAKSVAEGGSGIAEKFWGWCEEQVKQYL